MLDVEIINAWKRRNVREDDDDYEGRMNLVPPNNVAAAVERENQRAASATTPLPMSANEEAACAAGMLCPAPDHANINSSMHRCLNCRGEIHRAMWCGKNWGDYIMSANCRITPNQHTAAGRATIHDSDHELITICNVCVNSLESPNSLDKSHLDEQTAAALASSTTEMTVSTIEKLTTLIGMSVVDMHRWDRNQRSGGKAFDWMNSDDKRPDFLQVRTMTNLIAKGLHLAPMQYYDTNTPRPTITIRNRQPQQQHEL
jgi:hypothetical protein